MKKYWVLAVLTGLFVSAVWWVPELVQTPVPEVELVTMRQEEYTETFSVEGVVESPSTRELNPQYPFVPSQVLVEEGDYVEYGQLIAVIDPEQTAQALASVAKEYQDYLPEGIFPEVEEVFAQVDVDSLLEEGNISLELHAPMNGILTSVNLTEGELYLPTSPAAAVSSMTYLRIRLSVPEGEISALRVGQDLLFEAAAVPEGVFSATISRISPTAVRKLDGINYQTVVEVLARIDDDFGVLRPGYSIKAQIPRGEERQLSLLPYEAVTTDEEGQEYVYVLQDGMAVRRNVETGMELATAIEITEGLGKYEPVIRNADGLSGEGAVQLAGKDEE
ncbi:MAG: efflux RND transporter periplasmic adaptor subunit [Candidatus Merdivicinus sp.]